MPPKIKAEYLGRHSLGWAPLPTAAGLPQLTLTQAGPQPESPTSHDAGLHTIPEAKRPFFTYLLKRIRKGQGIAPARGRELYEAEQDKRYAALWAIILDPYSTNMHHVLDNHSAGYLSDFFDNRLDMFMCGIENLSRIWARSSGCNGISSADIEAERTVPPGTQDIVS